MTGALQIQLWKELRALLPWWAALVPTVAILGAASQIKDTDRGMRFLLAAGFVYVAGAAALGALSFGHDYAHRTLGPLLAQPASRKRLLGLKAAVLVPLLGLMGLVAAFTLGLEARMPRYSVFNEPAYQMMILGPMLAGGLLAPWLTIVARGPLAGAVFSVAIPVMVWMICNSFLLGTDVVWRATLALAAVGAVMTVRTFIRQESIDGPHVDLALPKWLRRTDRTAAVSSSKRSNWFGTAFWKELRLQQMTFAVAGLFVAAWTAIVFTHWINPNAEYIGPLLYAVANLYSGIVAIMAGALPAAEERHFGTADWQTLMPVAAWKQWTLKCAVAVGLAMILALGLPAFLLSLGPQVPGTFVFYPEMAFVVLLFAVTGLYLSSISATGLRAILGTAPALAATSVSAAAFFHPLSRQVRHLTVPLALEWMEPGSVTRQTAATTGLLVSVLLTAGLSLLVLTLAFHNHRSADRGAQRIVRQAAVILGFVTLAGLVLIILTTFLEAGIVQNRLR